MRCNVSAAQCLMNCVAAIGCRAACGVTPAKSPGRCRSWSSIWAARLWKANLRRRWVSPLPSTDKSCWIPITASCSPMTNGGKNRGENAERLLEGHEEANPLHHLLEGSLRQRVIEAIEALPEREKNGPLPSTTGKSSTLKRSARCWRWGNPALASCTAGAIKRLRAKLANEANNHLPDRVVSGLRFTQINAQNALLRPFDKYPQDPTRD